MVWLVKLKGLQVFKQMVEQKQAWMRNHLF